MTHGARVVWIGCLLLLSALTASASSALPDLDGTEITLGWKDFKALVEAGRTPQSPPEPPPEAAVLRSAEYEGTLRPGLLRLEGKLVVEVLRDGWVRVPLFPDGALVDFEAPGATLHRKGNALELISRGPGTVTVNATLAFPAADRPGENSLSIQLPRAASNLIRLTAEPPIEDLRAQEALVVRAGRRNIFASSKDGRFSLLYALPFQSTAEEAGEEVVAAPRVDVSATQFLDLGGGVIGGILVHDYRIRVAPVDHFDVEIPGGIEIFDCSAQGLENWKMLLQEERRVLRMTLGAPMEGSLRVRVLFEGSYEVDGSLVPVPRFAPLHVERESGFLAVSAEGAEVELSFGDGVLPADPSEIPEEVRAYGGNLHSALKYAGPPGKASVRIAEHPDAAVLTAIIERLAATTLLLENGIQATWLDLSIRNNRKQFLKLSFDGEETEVWSLLLDGEPAKPKRGEGELLIPLPPGNGERQASVSLVLFERLSEIPSLGVLEPAIPSLDIPVAEVLWTLYLPGGRSYRPSGRHFTVMRQPGNRLFRLPGLAAEPAPMQAEEAPPAASKELQDVQQKQEESIRRQMARRKGASRKGALPVRIAIPEGVFRMPRISVTRMFMVGGDDAALRIRATPLWLVRVVSGVRWLLLLAGAVCAGLWLAGRRSMRFSGLCACLLLLAVLPLPGPRWGASLAILILATPAVWLGCLVRSRLRRKRGDEGAAAPSAR